MTSRGLFARMGYFLFLLRGPRFGAVELMRIHTAYRYDPSPGDPARERTDSAHRCGVAFLAQCNSAGRKDAFYISPPTGTCASHGGVRQGPAEGVGASWSRPFLEEVAKRGRWFLATPYPPARVFGDVFPDLLGNSRLYLSMGESGVCISRYLRPSPAALNRCPRTVTYFIGDPLGYSPQKFGDIMRLIRKKSPSHACAVQLPGDIKFASTVVYYLQVCNDTGAIRPDAAASFYMESDGSSRRNEVKGILIYRPHLSTEGQPPRLIRRGAY